LVRFLENRVGDPRITSLIRRWLKAGILEDGELTANEKGTPQGSSISVLLSKRLDKYALALEPSKTKLIEFGRFAQRDARAQGRRPETLYFLGFTHFCTRNRKGNFKVGRKTEKSRLRRSLANLTPLMRDIRHWSLKDQRERLNQVLRGHYAYYGLAGNVRSMLKLCRAVQRYWHKMLCTRSWAASCTWDAFNELKERFSVTASKDLSALSAVTDLCCAVNQRLTSVVPEIGTLRSVGAGGFGPRRPGGCENGATVRVLGHRQTKEAATDNPHLMPPRHIPTLPASRIWAGARTPKHVDDWRKLRALR
jgi:RNA-directed DNA polymerase